MAVIKQISELIEEHDAKVAVDSRAVELGDVFFALPGERTDGCVYLPEVASKGARAAVVPTNYKEEYDGLVLFKVEDPLKTLQQIASDILRKRDAKIVAVTGSVGKTTTKEFITTLLGGKYRVAASPGNYNSQIGLPLTILNHTSGDEEVLVLEMGMTGPGHIANLVKIAPPDVAVITAVELVHAAYFDSLSDIARAKGEIFSSPKTRVGILAEGIVDIDLLCTIGSCKKRGLFKDIGLPELPVPGKHNRHNFLVAAAVAEELGMTKEEIVEAIPLLKLPERRFEVVDRMGVTFVNDSYNACLTSVRAALENLPAPKVGGKTIAVIGGIVEQGQFSEECHRQIGEHALEHVDYLMCLGEECGPIQEVWSKAGRPVLWAKDHEELIHEVEQHINPGDVVLLKGSNNKQLWKLVP